MEHDEGLQRLRRKYQKYSAEECRMVANFEYHATSADQLFNEAVGHSLPAHAIPGEAVALAIYPSYAPTILAIGTHEYILGRTEEAIRLLLELIKLPYDTKNLVIIIGKAASFMIARNDIGMAMKLYSVALETFPDEHTFQDGVAYCMEREHNEG